MTKLLIRLFIRDPANIQDRTVRTAYGNLACMVGIVCNVLLFAGKFTVGTLFGSMAIAADALNNLSDASSNVVSLVGFRLGSKPADDEHPYGHARYEYLAGLAVAAMILLIGAELVKTSIGKILHPGYKKVMLCYGKGYAGYVDFLKAVLPMRDRGTFPVMATRGDESSMAVAIPVTGLVAPGPDVAMTTPVFPVARA